MDEIVLAAVMHNGNALFYFFWLVLQKIQFDQSGNTDRALKHALEDPKKDKDIVLAAVKQIGHTLRYASDPHLFPFALRVAGRRNAHFTESHEYTYEHHTHSDVTQIKTCSTEPQISTSRSAVGHLRVDELVDVTGGVFRVTGVGYRFNHRIDNTWGRSATALGVLGGSLTAVWTPGLVAGRPMRVKR